MEYASFESVWFYIKGFIISLIIILILLLIERYNTFKENYKLEKRIEKLEKNNSRLKMGEKLTSKYAYIIIQTAEYDDDGFTIIAVFDDKLKAQEHINTNFPTFTQSKDDETNYYRRGDHWSGADNDYLDIWEEKLL